jgi:PAS domain S-box-containing protein
MDELLERVERLATRGLRTGEEPRFALEQICRLVADGGARLSDDNVLRDIISTIPYFVFWKDRQCVYQGCNNTFGRAAGCETPEQIVGKTDYQLPWKKAEADFFVQCDQRVMSTGVAEVNIEEPQLQADGRQRTLETSKVPLRDADGKVVGILGIFRDITERKQLEEELRAAKGAAEASDKAKGDFLAAMSHELRTPLTLILGPLESLLQDHTAELSEQTLTSLRRMHRNACRLKVLTDDILDYSKGQAGLDTLSLETIDLAPHVAELVDDMQAAASAKGIQLTFEVAGPVRVKTDVSKLDKMLLNLVGNALKFTPACGRVAVRLSQDPERFVLAVSDTGIGIDPSHHDALFQRFVQVDAGSTRKYGGTGLGLALVKQFCELLGGQVTLHSKLGHGCEFAIALPRRTTSSDALSLPPASDTSSCIDARRRTDALTEETTQAPSSTTRTATDRLPKLLVAEDNPDLRNYIVSLFVDEFQVLVADNGAQAFQLVSRELPDVVISDVMMPVMDGFEFVQKVRADPALQTTPIILLTARAGAESSASSLESGADDYIAKPFNPLDLRARVRAARRMNDLHARLAEARARSEESERLASLGRLLAKLSHEINNPVNVIANSAEVLKGYTRSALHYADACTQALPSEAQDRFAALREELDWAFLCEDFPVGMNQIAEAAARVKDLQTDFRLFLRGKSALSLQAGDINAAVRLSVQQAKAGIPNTCKIETRLAPLGECRFDAPRLGQVLLNLLKNAAEAAGPHGEIVIETSEDLNAAYIAVTDNGPGVPGDLMGKIFEPLFSTKEIGLGTGLGLAICREIVEHHGGALRVSNTELGARFLVELPKRLSEGAIRRPAGSQFDSAPELRSDLGVNQ